MIPVIISVSYGGFGISKSALEEYTKRTGKKYIYDRSDPVMVEIIKEIGKEANTKFSDLVVKLIPDDFKNYYTILEYDGSESIELDFSKYKLSKISQIVESGGSMEQIKTILDQTPPKNYYYR